MEMSQVARMISTWAQEKPLVKRAYIFGSRVRGDHRPDSDIDIAVELDPDMFRGVDGSGGRATWMFETDGWKEELEKLLALKVQLERYHPDQTPTVGKGLARSSQLVYEKPPNPGVHTDAQDCDTPVTPTRSRRLLCSESRC